MSLNQVLADLVRSTQSGLGGTVFQRALAGVIICAAATSVEGDILDFEALPYPTASANPDGGTVGDPFGSHMGFRFSSVNFFPPGALFAGVWFDYALTNTPYYGSGYPYGINGARALGTPMYASAQPCTLSIEREDGGEWMFEGAQFCRVMFFHPSAVFRIVGWRDGGVVYDTSTLLPDHEQLFFGAQVGTVAVDKMVMTFRYFSSSGTQYSTWFTMDDMHYELVPAPGALVLLGMCGLLRRRQRA